jgi:hypothetical protein
MAVNRLPGKDDTMIDQRKAELAELIAAELREAYRTRQDRIDHAIRRFESVVARLETTGEALPIPDRARLVRQADIARIEMETARDSLREVVALQECAEKLAASAGQTVSALHA